MRVFVTENRIYIAGGRFQCDLQLVGRVAGDSAFDYFLHRWTLMVEHGTVLAVVLRGLVSKFVGNISGYVRQVLGLPREPDPYHGLAWKETPR